MTGHRVPYSTPDPNSRAAADSVRDTSLTKREQVYQLLRSDGDLCEWQIEDRLGWGGNTVRPRLLELMELEFRVARRQGGRTPSGRACYIYFVGDPRRVAADLAGMVQQTLWGDEA